MGWREKMGGSGSGKVNPETHTKNTINPKKEPDQAISSISSIPSMGIENEKGYPIPDSESKFAEDERNAIIHFDGRGADELEMIDNVKMMFDGVVMGAGAV